MAKRPGAQPGNKNAAKNYTAKAVSGIKKGFSNATTIGQSSTQVSDGRKIADFKTGVKRLLNTRTTRGANGRQRIGAAVTNSVNAGRGAVSDRVKGVTRGIQDKLRKKFK